MRRIQAGGGGITDKAQIPDPNLIDFIGMAVKRRFDDAIGILLLGAIKDGINAVMRVNHIQDLAAGLVIIVRRRQTVKRRISLIIIAQRFSQPGRAHQHRIARPQRFVNLPRQAADVIALKIGMPIEKVQAIGHRQQESRAYDRGRRFGDKTEYGRAALDFLRPQNPQAAPQP